MIFNVALDNQSIYTISFTVDEDATFCNIFDSSLHFVISAGHSILSPDDDFNTIEGMKHSLRRALDAPPSLFDRETRGMIWDSFWEAVDTNALVSSNWYDEVIYE